jgi:hypothetical protein
MANKKTLKKTIGIPPHSYLTESTASPKLAGRFEARKFAAITDPLVAFLCSSSVLSSTKGFQLPAGFRGSRESESAPIPVTKCDRNTLVIIDLYHSHIQ